MNITASIRSSFQRITTLLVAMPVLLALAACTQAGSGASPTVTPASSGPSTNPAPQLTPSPSISSAYPAPGELPPSEPAMLAPFMESAALLMTKTDPPQPLLRVTGDLPTGCYSLRHKVAPPDANGRINVSLAVVPPAPGVNCTDVTQAVTLDIPLEDLTAGLYQVYLNGVKVGSLQAP
jgi:hypothetical protein